MANMRRGDGNLQPLLLAGPTAVGKSEVALTLAEALGGEIIAVDSMQVYRGLDIGTAKPSPAERARVPHHLVDVVDLTASFDAARFLQLARAAVADIQSRGHIPILCGGTGLYFQVFLEGLGEAPPADAQLRADLSATPKMELLRELAARDPITYERIDRQNLRRVIRAIEVIRITGKPFSAQRADWRNLRATEPAANFYGLSRASDVLHARIAARVDEMFRRGLVAETQTLLQHGLARNPTALLALGYRQVVEYLNGARSLTATIELVKTRTRQFAKRQMTWFRKHAPLKWMALGPAETARAAAERLLNS
jgi:tRNA dimethylallyltransferase